MAIILRRLQYYKNNTSVGYSVESEDEDRYVIYSFMFQGHLVDGHYALQNDTKFQARNKPNAGYHTRIIGIAHSKEEADDKIYRIAVREAEEMTRRSGKIAYCLDV